MSLPIACTPGEDCWVTFFVDVGAGPATQDFTCGRRTYDGHKGVDFALRDRAAMRRGVLVLAAAPGIVKGLRDGMADVDFRSIDPEQIAKRECGNGVLLDHGGGWTTQYCHMLKGSVAVQRGQRVTVGQPLGKVGLSGKTNFPHLHFQLKRDGAIVDPYTGARATDGCRAAAETRWQPDVAALLPYRPFEIYNAGLSNRKPNVKAIRNGTFESWSKGKGDGAVYVWVDTFGLETGDQAVFALRDADGRQLFTRRLEISKRSTRRLIYVGKKIGRDAADPIPLVGTVRLQRTTSDGTVTEEVEVRPSGQ
ncbi:MAG: M23 family metallopeptidase [Alphaproteobacteria bacterium]|nr:M23 family metallopeptidase [Alphaproteobacteria bacterium]